MKKIKNILPVIVCLMLLLAFPIVSFAHSGRTDSNGGHRDNKNKSGLGSYHYHCGGYPAHLHDDGICPYAPKDKITIRDYDSTMYIGENQTFSYDIESVYSYVRASITSSDDNVVSVNGTTLTAKGAGTATITVETKTAVKTFKITVKEVFAESIDICIPQELLQVGKTMCVSSQIYPENTSNKTVEYTSSNSNIATVSADGTITGLSLGEVVIKATTSNGVSTDVKITIFEVYPQEIGCKDKINLIVGDKYTLDVEIYPENSNNKEYTVSVEDEEYIRVSNNSISAIKEGTTKLYVETWNGIKKELLVQVDYIPVEEIIINDDSEYLLFNMIDKSSSIAFSTEINPKNATYQDVVWTSSDEKVVAVEENGFVINKTGQVTLTCTSKDNIAASVSLIVFDKDILVVFIFVFMGVSGFLFIRHKKRKNRF